MKGIPTTCGICRSNGCGVLAFTDEEGKVNKVTGLKEHPMSRGTLCVKAAHSLEALYSPNRILKPMVRTGARGEGKWKEVEWDEALDKITDGFVEMLDKYGPTSIGGVIGSPNRTHNTFIALLMRLLGAPNIMADSDLCSGGNWLGSMLTAGDSIGRQIWNPDIKNTDCIMVAGLNPAHSKNPQWKTDWPEAKKRGVKLIVIDPRRTDTAKQADIHLAVNPGTDAALALAMINVVIEEDLYDKEYVDEFCYGFEEMKERAKEYAPEKVEKIVGIPSDDIRKVARIFATSGAAGIWFGLGLIQNANTVQSHRAYMILSALTGNINRPGGNMLPRRCKGFKGNWELWHNEEWRPSAEVEAQMLGAKEFPLWTSFTKSSFNPFVIDAILTGKPYPVRSLYVSGANIIATYPDSRKVMEALKSLDFLVVSEYEMTPVAALADVVLPKAHWLANGPDAVINPWSMIVSVHQRTMEPLGEAKDKNWICIEIAKRLEKKTDKINRRFIPWNSVEEYFEWKIKDANIDADELLEKGFVPYESAPRKTFNTPTGKIEFVSVILKNHGYDPLPSHITIEENIPSDEYPLYLLTGPRTVAFQHTRFRDCPSLLKMEPEPYMEIHPKAAKDYGLKDGDWVSVSTEISEGQTAKFKTKITENIHERTVSIPLGWWYREQEGPEYGTFESNPNVLVRQGLQYPHDPITGAGLTRGIRCQITKL